VRLLVLGGSGMLGHQLVASWRGRHDVHATERRELDALDPAAVRAVVERIRPQVVINAIGVVKQRTADPIASIATNALFPHQLAAICAACEARLVLLGTDCVFSGKVGGYRESDAPDPEDLYGRTKLLGEVIAPHVITLRSSIIGLERANNLGLVEWFLAQRGPIKGFRKAIFSGFSTIEMARILELVAASDRHGLYHVASTPIDKYSLLVGLRDRLGRDLAITPDDTFACDRSLDATRFHADFDYTPPAWDAMLDELASQIRLRTGQGRSG
jgi:dTDP-4-dehydrorhamnose reductase